METFLPLQSFGFCCLCQEWWIHSGWCGHVSWAERTGQTYSPHTTPVCLGALQILSCASPCQTTAKKTNDKSPPVADHKLLTSQQQTFFVSFVRLNLTFWSRSCVSVKRNSTFLALPSSLTANWRFPARSSILTKSQTSLMDGFSIRKVLTREKLPGRPSGNIDLGSDKTRLTTASLRDPR